MGSDRIDVDTSNEGIVIVTFHGVIDDAMFAEHLEDMSRRIATGARRVAIVDGTHRTEQVPSTQRRMQAEWMKTHQQALERTTLATLFVLNSSIMRGILTAIFWMQPIPTPHKIFATLDEALAYAKTLLAR